MRGLGQVIGGKYRLLHIIGRGGMGSVWLAEHLDLEARVAIKFIDEAGRGDWRMHERFTREARACAALRSPHVVQVLDYGVHDNVPFMVMEHLTGESLAVRLLREPQLSPGCVVLIVNQLAQALGRAHGMGIVHRDIKPANLFLLDDDGLLQVKVLDFGLAKALESVTALPSLTEQGAVVGTLEYMAPERFEGVGTSPSSDLWATAVVAFECLLGFRPFSAKTVPELVKSICKHRVVPSAFAQVPAAFDAWFARATATALDLRFPTATALATALADALNGLADTPVPLGPAGQARLPSKPHAITAYSVAFESQLGSEDRISSTIPAAIDGHRDFAHVALIVAITRDAARLWTRRELAVGRQLQLSIHFDDELHGIPASGTVVRAHPMRPGESDVWSHSVVVQFEQPLVGFDAQLATVESNVPPRS